MALKAGRRGLHKSLVTSSGRLKSGVVSIPDATTSKKGVVKIGSGLSVASGTVSVKNGVPNFAVADAGKVLSVSDTGSLEWVEPSAGGAGGVIDIITESVKVIENAYVGSTNIGTSTSRDVYVIDLGENYFNVWWWGHDATGHDYITSDNADLTAGSVHGETSKNCSPTANVPKELTAAKRYLYFDNPKNQSSGINNIIIKGSV